MPKDALNPADTWDLESDPERAAQLCRAGHERWLVSLRGLDDSQARRPSRLPGWSVGHLITHLARNADAHARRLDGALRGEDVPKYPGGPAQRESEIAAGAGRSARDLVADLEHSQQELDQLFTRCSAAGWPGRELLGGGDYPATASPAHRLRETEMHHVDLGMGYEPEDWPAEYVAWDLRCFLDTVPDRLRRPGERSTFLFWLAGRTASLGEVALDPL